MQLSKELLGVTRLGVTRYVSGVPWVVCCGLCVVCRVLWVVGCELWVVGCGLWTVCSGYGLYVVGYELWGVGCALCVAFDFESVCTCTRQQWRISGKGSFNDISVGQHYGAHCGSS